MAKKDIFQEPTVRKVKTSDKTRLHINTFLTDDGTQMVNVRKFYQDKSGEWKPAAQGITFPVEVATKFRKNIRDACDNADEEAVKLPPRQKKDKS